MTEDKKTVDELQEEVQPEDEVRDNTEEVEKEDELKTDEESVDEEIIDLKNQVEELKEEKEKYYNQLLRLQADFVNFRKRSAREKARISLNTKISLLEDLLPVIDNFERALNSAEEDNSFKQGIEMIYRQLQKFLHDQGVEIIPTEGESFDHNLHEAMMQVEDEQHDSGIVIEELQKGYLLGDKVIRPAMVKVAK